MGEQKGNMSSVNFERIDRTGDGTVFSEMKVCVTSQSVIECRDIVKEFLKDNRR